MSNYLFSEILFSDGLFSDGLLGENFLHHSNHPTAAAYSRFGGVAGKSLSGASGGGEFWGRSPP